MDADREHPVRLVVTDDLQRSRLTVFFRLLLAIPHLLWLGLFAQVVFLLTIANWFATLFAGRSPEGIHKFVAGYVRYVVRLNAYLFLAANPFPAFFLIDDEKPYPVDVEIDPPRPQRRLKTLFRLVLVIPALVLLTALTVNSGSRSSTGMAAAGSFFGWFASLVRGRMPRGLRDLALWVLGYTVQTSAYLLLLTDRYPYAGPELHLASVEPPERLDRPQAVVAGELRRSRLLALFRIPVVFPHVVWYVGWSVLVLPAALANWLCTLALGRAPRPLARFLSAYVRYGAHLSAFFWLVGNPFPGFVGKAGSYPVDLELDPFARQHRLVTLFRLLLAVPALVLAGAAWGVLCAAGFLGWFVALVRGRMPEGLRNAGAFAVGYLGQVGAYVLVLGSRYPLSSPIGTWRSA